jgi:hypothetical protein
MTGYTVHTGSSEDFASGWDRVFGGEKKKSQPKGEKPGKGKAKAKSQAKKSKKK